VIVGLKERMGREMVAVIAALMLVLFAAFTVYYYGVMMQPGASHFFGNDFLSFHAAGRLAVEGQAAAAYDGHLHQAMMDRIAAEVTGAPKAETFYFGYPPTYLLTIAGLGALPYLPALAVFQGLSAALYLAALWRIWPSWRTVLVGLAIPVCLVNFYFGQNGFLTAGLAGLALALWPRRPFLAGLVLGLLTIKPQLGLAYPLALIVIGQWRMIAGAVTSTLTLMLAAAVVLGGDIWPAFLHRAGEARTELFEQSGVGFGRIQSLFSLVRFSGADVAVAYAAQGALCVTVAAILIMVWRSRASCETKAALVLTATLLMSPFCLVYDFVTLVPAGLFLLKAQMARGARSEGLELALLVTAMLILPTAVILPLKGVIFGWPTLVLAFAIALWSARQDLRLAATSVPA
jgi:hypothetical protein